VTARRSQPSWGRSNSDRCRGLRTWRRRRRFPRGRLWRFASGPGSVLVAWIRLVLRMDAAWLPVRLRPLPLLLRERRWPAAASNADASSYLANEYSAAPGRSPGAGRVLRQFGAKRGYVLEVAPRLRSMNWAGSDWRAGALAAAPNSGSRGALSAIAAAGPDPSFVTG
jgi:hypothetical protein